MKGNLIIVAFFILGCITGLYNILPFNIAETDISFYALCALMFSVGLSIGNDPQTIKNFRSLNPRLVFLPGMTILGTLAGAAMVSFVLTHRTTAECMAVGSGFGYYSLSSIFITEYKGAELGTIALLSNISKLYISRNCVHLSLNSSKYCLICLSLFEIFDPLSYQCKCYYSLTYKTCPYKTASLYVMKKSCPTPLSTPQILHHHKPINQIMENRDTFPFLDLKLNPTP